jgi:hypothetical protein
MARPYLILEKVRNSYQIGLPDSIKVNNIFLPDKLCLASSSKLLEGQLLDLQSLINIDGQDKYKVEEILAVKLHYQKLEYQVK